MPLTRAEVETVLVGRARDLLDLLGMATVHDGANADLADPIAFATRQAGYAVVVPTAPTDADLALVAERDVDFVLDVAEYRLLETILTRVRRKVTQRVGFQSQINWSELATGLEMSLERMAADLRRRYGLGRSSLSAGTIKLPTAAGDPATTPRWAGW
jgi:hypothetical protein